MQNILLNQMTMMTPPVQPEDLATKEYVDRVEGLLNKGGLVHPFMNLYFTTDGSDTTGDGSQDAPFRSFEGLNRLQTLVKGHCACVRMNFGEGEFDTTPMIYLCTPYQNFTFSVAQLYGKNTETNPDATTLTGTGSQVIQIATNSPLKSVFSSNVSYKGGAANSAIINVNTPVLFNFTGTTNISSSASEYINAGISAMYGVQLVSSGAVNFTGGSFNQAFYVSVDSCMYMSGTAIPHFRDCALTNTFRVDLGGKVFANTATRPTFANVTGAGSVWALYGGNFIIAQGSKDPTLWSPTGSTRIDTDHNSFITGVV